jgi:hypothetical protein
VRVPLTLVLRSLQVVKGTVADCLLDSAVFMVIRC